MNPDIGQEVGGAIDEVAVCSTAGDAAESESGGESSMVVAEGQSEEDTGDTEGGKDKEEGTEGEESNKEQQEQQEQQQLQRQQIELLERRLQEAERSAEESMETAREMEGVATALREEQVCTRSYLQDHV